MASQRVDRFRVVDPTIWDVESENRSLVVLVVRSDSLEVISFVLRDICSRIVRALFRRYMQIPLPRGSERLHRQVF
jgi:hypothetical protein